MTADVINLNAWKLWHKPLVGEERAKVIEWLMRHAPPEQRLTGLFALGELVTPREGS